MLCKLDTGKEIHTHKEGGNWDRVTGGQWANPGINPTVNPILVGKEAWQAHHLGEPD